MNTTKLKNKKVLIPAVAVLVLGAGTATAFATDSAPGMSSSDRLTGADRDKAERAALAEVGDPKAKVTDAEREDDDGDDASDPNEAKEAYEIEVTKADGTEVDVTLDADFAVLSTDTDGPEGSDDDNDGDDRAVTGADRDKAEQAALKAVPGEVSKVETDTPDADDTGWEKKQAYAVDVIAKDGTDWDVALDADFTVLHQEKDD